LTIAPPAARIFAVFVLLLGCTVAFPEETLALPPGVYSLGGAFDEHRGQPRRLDFPRTLSTDGEWVFSDRGLGSTLIYTDGRRVDAGAGEFDTGLSPDIDADFYVHAISPSGTTRLGRLTWRDPDTGALGRRDVIQPSDGPSADIVGSGPEAGRAISPNGEFVLRNEFELVGGITPIRPRVWSRGMGYVDYSTPDGMRWADPQFVANDGTVAGLRILENELADGTVQPGLREGLIVWEPDGTARLLDPPTWESGVPWLADQIHAFSSGGTHVVASDGPYARVLDVDSGDNWQLNSVPAGGSFVEVIEANAVTADGSMVVGSAEFDGPIGRFEYATVWTRDGGHFELSTFLQLAGIDTTGWGFSKIMDVSDDGRTFIGLGGRAGSPDYLFYAVIPEPNTALLLGFGLATLSWSRRGLA